jgi:hypothetical protein
MIFRRQKIYLRAAIICSIVAWQMVRHDFPASQDTLFILMESYQRFVMNESRAT